MPLSRERQRQLARKYPSLKVAGNTLARCAACALHYYHHYSILPEPIQFHYYRHHGIWHATPYVDTTATEQAIDASIERYNAIDELARLRNCP